MDNSSVRAGDPFAYAGGASASEAEDLSPDGCIEGTVYIGHMAHDEETGEEVEVIDRVPCRKCLGTSSAS